MDPPGAAPDRPVRLAHFSDIHLTTRPLGWALRDLRSKRLTGWFHLRALGRGRQFKQAHDVARALVREFRDRRPDRIVFAGDATALGFASETARVAADGGVGLWLHGHRHRAYALAKPDLAPFPVVCAGSASQLGRAGYWDFRISGRRLTGRRRIYDAAARTFPDGEAFEIELAG